MKGTDFPQILLKHGEKFDWRTPISLYKVLNDEFHFRLDACTSKDNPLGIPTFYTEYDNGLYQPWYDPTYVNPPYGKEKIIAWIQKARLEQTNGITSVFLLPARTGTIWFHRYIYQKPDIEIRFLKGRLIFDGNENRKQGSNTAPFDSMIVIFRGCANLLD